MLINQIKGFFLSVTVNTITVVLLVLAACSGALAQSRKPPASVPERNKPAVQLDQTLNTAHYAAKGQFPSGHIVPIYHVDIPEASLEISRSEYLDDETAKHVRIVKNGRVYYRVFFLKPGHFPNGKQSYYGTKLLSHNTYKVWNPDQPDLPDINIKFSKSDGTNSAANVVQAINTNDVVEALFAASPKKPAKNYLPERFGATYKGVSYSIRNEIPPGHQENQDHDILPLHAVLGIYAEQVQRPAEVFTIYKKAAQMMGISVEDWIVQQYIPRLTEFIFNLTVELGIFPAAHTQNLKIILNNKTGEVVGFVFRDMNDVQIDPNLTIISVGFSKAVQDILKNIPTKMISQSIALNAVREPIRSPGTQLGAYFFQSLTFIGDTFSENRSFVYRKISNEFLVYFLQLMENKLQKKIVLSSSAIQAWNRLQDPAVPCDCRSQSGPILDEAFAFYTRTSLARLLPQQAPDHQDLLEKLFRKSLKEGNVAFVVEGPEERMAYVDLEFIPFENTIIAREKRYERNIFATAYGLSEADRKQLRKIVLTEEVTPLKEFLDPKSSSKRSCLNLFKI